MLWVHVVTTEASHQNRYLFARKLYWSYFGMRRFVLAAEIELQ
jgi:hypothetical protein